VIDALMTGYLKKERFKPKIIELFLACLKNKHYLCAVKV
jgi:hypothetical protein